MDLYLENENFQEPDIQSENEVFEVLNDSEETDDPVSTEENNGPLKSTSSSPRMYIQSNHPTCPLFFYQELLPSILSSIP